MKITVICISVLALASTSQALTVTSATDSVPGSLRAVLASAVDGDSIDFAAGLDGATITLTGGSLLIDNLEVTIDASSLPSGLTLDGDGSDRVFGISNDAFVNLVGLTIQNGAVTGNGGGILLSMSYLSATDCHVTNCTATGQGGGLRSSSSQVILVDSTIRDCSAGSLGGGAYFGGSPAGSIERCRIIGNSVTGTGSGGGVHLGTSSPIVISNSLIAGNLCPPTTGGDPAGGGVSCQSSSPQILNCTIQGNSGGGIANVLNSNPVLRNSIVWGNTGTGLNTAANQVFNAFISETFKSQPDIAHSLIEGASGSASFADGNLVVWGGGNLDGTDPGNDPDFAAALPAASSPTTASDLRLLASSPVLNVGNGADVSGSLDLAGKTRIQQTIVDFGAFEGGYVTFPVLHPGLNPFGDENQNGKSNLTEYGLGLDPSASPGAGGSPEIDGSSGNPVLTLQQRTNALDLTIRWRFSDDLQAWADMSAGIDYMLQSIASVSGEVDSFELELIPVGPRRFYRQEFELD